MWGLTPTVRTDLAAHCRLLLHDRPRNKLFYRWAVLYPLYALSEIAIVCTDLAELLGSAMALSMLFPSLDVWAGVLITTADVLLLLAMRNPIGGHPVRGFELGIAVLVSAKSVLPPPPHVFGLGHSLAPRRRAPYAYGHVGPCAFARNSDGLRCARDGGPDRDAPKQASVAE